MDMDGDMDYSYDTTEELMFGGYVVRPASHLAD